MSAPLTAESSLLIVMDVQERLVAAMPEDSRGNTIDNVIRLVQGARILGVPVLVTEQYPNGLGHTIDSVNQALEEFEQPPARVPKLDFNAIDDARFGDALETMIGTRKKGQPPGVVLCGLETHICVYQTAKALAGRCSVHVPYDATCSRRQEDHRVAQGLLDGVGVTVTTTETVLFELLKRAGSEEFKAISKLLR